MTALRRVLERRPLAGLLAIAVAWALLGCCCPTLPLVLTRSAAAPGVAAPPDPVPVTPAPQVVSTGHSVVH